MLFCPLFGKCRQQKASNMQSMIDHYRELIGLTQIYLRRNCSSKERVSVTPALFSYFSYDLKDPVLKDRVSSLEDKEDSKAPKPFPPQPVNPQLPQNKLTMEKRAEKNTSTMIPEPDCEKESPSIKEAIKVVTQPIEKKEELQPSSISPDLQKQKRAFLSLDPFSPARHDLSEFWKLHLDLFPDTSLYETIPDDAVALKIKNSWKQEQTVPPVVILSFNDKENETAFLINVAKAISLRFLTARVISASRWEKELGWEALLNSPLLKLVIAPDHDFYMDRELMKHYRSDNHGRHTLKNAPLLLLSDPSLYLKEPQLKPLLWRAFCNDFAASN